MNNTIKFLLSAVLAAMLSACALVENNPLDGHRAVYSWQGRGKIQFVCDYDERGFYWRFLRQNGRLSTDAGEPRAELIGERNIKLPDGNVLILTVNTVLRRPNTANAADLIYDVTNPALSGPWRQVVFVKRTATSGGMPLTGCSAAQRDKVLSVPFSARYILYR